MWDDRCAVCHGHPGDFARKYLSVSGSLLLGLHHRDDLKLFIGECTGCHETAVEFVRRSLEIRGGVLFNRTSGNPIDLHGSRHTGPDPDDALFFVDLLTRIAREVGQQ